MSESYKKLRTIDKIMYGLALTAVLGTLGALASFADKFYEAVESLPTPVRETIQTNYTITEICGSGAGTTREVIYSENPPICSDDAGISTCHIDGKVVSGILNQTVYEGTGDGPTVQVDGELCGLSTLAEVLLWQRVDADSVLQLKK